MAKRVRRWVHNPKFVNSSPAVDKKNFSFCKSRFRSLQLEEAHANEIKHDIPLANTLFQIKVGLVKNMAVVCSGISLFMYSKTGRRRMTISYLTIMYVYSFKSDMA